MHMTAQPYHWRPGKGLLAAASAFLSVMGLPASAMAGDGWEIERGDRMCGLAGQYSDDGGSLIYLAALADGTFVLDVSNSNWSIAPDIKYPMVFAFDDEFYVGEANGYSEDGRRGFLIKGSDEMADQFAKARKLGIIKKDDQKIVLHIGLIGSSSGVARLRSCIAAVKRELAIVDAKERALAAKREIIPADPFFDSSAAIPRGSPGGWVTNDDYPPRALREGREGDTVFKLTISPDGVVSACSVTKSSRSPDLDAATCNLATRRARFNSIPNAAPNRYYENVIRWRVPK